jgi:hypothetical protein
MMMAQMALQLAQGSPPGMFNIEELESYNSYSRQYSQT